MVLRSHFACLVMPSSSKNGDRWLHVITRIFWSGRADSRRLDGRSVSEVNAFSRCRLRSRRSSAAHSRRSSSSTLATLMNSLLCDVRPTATEAVWRLCRDDAVATPPLPSVNMTDFDICSSRRAHQQWMSWNVYTHTMLTFTIDYLYLIIYYNKTLLWAKIQSQLNRKHTETSMWPVKFEQGICD